MFKRGFKSWCEKTAEQYRKDLGLKSHDPLSPWDMAKQLSVLIWTPEDVPELSEEDLTRLTQDDVSSWSAVTLKVGHSNLIIVNSGHGSTRQTSSVMHELSHIILNHTPARVDVSEFGHLLLNNYDKTQEEEADWLGGTLLVPRNALLAALKHSNNAKETAAYFGVSQDMLNWRRRMTGVDVQLRRRSA